MPTRVNFVVSVGRMSTGDLVARPVIEQVAGSLGGRVIGGAGSSSDPIVAEFADKAKAEEAAKQLWYHDAIEAAHVVDVDSQPTSALKEAAKTRPAYIAESEIGVHHIPDSLDDGEAYDHTQVTPGVRGKVLVHRGRVGFMSGAWPVSVVGKHDAWHEVNHAYLATNPDPALAAGIAAAKAYAAQNGIKESAACAGETDPLDAVLAGIASGLSPADAAKRVVEGLLAPAAPAPAPAPAVSEDAPVDGDTHEILGETFCFTAGAWKDADGAAAAPRIATALTKACVEAKKKEKGEKKDEKKDDDKDEKKDDKGEKNGEK